MQVNGALAHKRPYTGVVDCFSGLLKEQGVRGLYNGFSLNVIRCLPLTLLQYVVFQATRGISEEKQEFRNPVIQSKLEKLKYA